MEKLSFHDCFLSPSTVINGITSRLGWRPWRLAPSFLWGSGERSKKSTRSKDGRQCPSFPLLFGGLEV